MKYLMILILLVGVVLENKAQNVVRGNKVDDSIMSVRLRSFDNTGGDELYIGVPSLGDENNREQMNYTWWYLNFIEISYDHMSDTLSVALYHCEEDDDDDRSHPICDDDDDRALRSPHILNYHNWTDEVQSILGSQFSHHNLVNMSIELYNRELNGGEVSFEDVKLNGVPLGGDFNIPPTSTVPTIDKWSIVDTCFNDFLLTGFIKRQGDFSNSQELTKIEFNIGTSTERNDGIFNNGFENCYNL